jgi:hypothetical protein
MPFTWNPAPRWCKPGQITWNVHSAVEQFFLFGGLRRSLSFDPARIFEKSLGVFPQGFLPSSATLKI